MKPGTWTSNITINANASAASTFTNMPAADTFLFSSHRHVCLIDLTGMTYVRFKVNKQTTAGSTGSKLILRYSPIFSTNVADYRDIGVTEVSVPVDTTNTYLSTEWIELAPAAIDDVYLAVIGNGTLDPAFGHISVSVV